MAALLIGAPYLLGISGADYAREGTTLLRLLALSALPNIICVLYLGIARVQGRLASIVAIEATRCVFVLALSYGLFGRYGITGIGIAWLVVDGTVAAALFPTRFWPILRPSFKRCSLVVPNVRSASERNDSRTTDAASSTTRFWAYGLLVYLEGKKRREHEEGERCRAL